MKYLITADIYNFNFFRGNIEINNWKLIPYKNTHNINNRIKEENISLSTGISELYININEGSEKVIEHGKDILNLYSKLLSFTENADIYFNNYRCYEIVNDEQVLKIRSYYPIKVRKVWGYSHFRYIELIEFLEKSTILILDDIFMEKTNIDRTLDWYNLAQSTDIFDTRFLLLFISLEIVANSWAKYSNSYFIINEICEKSLIKNVKNVMKRNMKLKKSLRKQIYENIRSLNRRSIKNKTMKMCSDLKIDIELNELKKMIKIRNEIVHGDRINYSSELFDYNPKLENIIKNVVYNLFGVEEYVRKLHFRSF